MQAIPIGGSLFRLREARRPQQDRIDRCFTRNQNGNGKVALRGRGGNSVPPVFGSERQAVAFIKAGIAKGTVVNADDGRRAEIDRRCAGPR
ncbi:hypothetical protein [Bradyrhizobium elkanii]|uniref:hypothetical protein n=1 Tax=Bradyrhizobium elkanii TaxID=29448 RepID=UPI001AE24BAF|nr:hypothetical protein [Bradyrhizobium elkanii]MBP2428801.1 hypothetical protein [Bradyrhizobium elkanii]WLA93641.1 hypothetical protein QNJ96_10375 [Bradyrhizobium elkanii]